MALAQDRYEAGSLVVIAGVPGSGKSTYARTQFPDALLVNPDALRAQLVNSAGEWDQSLSAAAFRRARGIIKEGMTSGLRPVVLDATNVDPRELAKLVKLGHTLRPRRSVHLVLVEASLQLARERNRQRGVTNPLREVPDHVIGHFAQRMEDLTTSEVLRSFDSVERVDAAHLETPALPATPAPSRAHLLASINELLMRQDAPERLREMAKGDELSQLLPGLAATIGFDQKSAYHELPLFDHELAVLEAAISFGASLSVRWAAVLHDNGKVESAWECMKQHPNTPNAPMPHQHFYGRYEPDLRTRVGENFEDVGGFATEDHEVVGARMAEQELLELGMEGPMLREVVTLVRLHMAKGADTLARAEKLLGRAGPYIDGLLVLHAADRAGHAPSPAALAEARELLTRELAMIEEARRVRVEGLPAPAPHRRLSVDGRMLHREAGLAGAQIGQMLRQLSGEVAAGSLVDEQSLLLARACELSGEVRASVRPFGKRR